MDEGLDTAEERARLAVADLAAAASAVIAWRVMRPEDVRDDVGAAVLSRRFTSFAPSRALDEAHDDLDFASRARAEIDSLSTPVRTPPPRSDAVAIAAERRRVDRLTFLADACERRAVALRSTC
jgi:hypothetical protein